MQQNGKKEFFWEKNKQLYDLVNDPGEMNNLAYDPAFEHTIKLHRKMLYQKMQASQDTVRIINEFLQRHF